MTFVRGRRKAPGKADLHIHTSHGDGMAEPAELLDFVEERTDLSIIAIVDHDAIDGALETRETWARGRYRFEVLTGIEVTTREGHLLALDIEAPVPSFRPIEETVRFVHDAGGLCVVPHPLSWLTRSIGQRGIERVLASSDPLVAFDGIEVANKSPAGRICSQRADELNERFWRLPRTGGSDAHFLQAVGSCYTTFPGRTIADLRAALRAGTTDAGQAYHPTMRELGYSQVVRQQWRGLMVTPRNVFFRPLARRLSRGTA